VTGLYLVLMVLVVLVVFLVFVVRSGLHHGLSMGFLPVVAYAGFLCLAVPRKEWHISRGYVPMAYRWCGVH
jgi:hypothetical protein